ncbi:Uncharacterized membrane protein, DUF373 family [Roseomonas rosea]|uniref:Uncharacterized membrane protein, DUF373 family n=1 Tax=Muricoccus roseus TaxID=198092 RepID=A0A1M6SP80_9PROT|nr:phosphate-starvation-inducible PsiE family protein [Roseomonas rosea]SHK46513.1 Uncharacterized membrane protein, DUF373 family [Roseomonas rosea]
MLDRTGQGDTARRGLTGRIQDSIAETRAAWPGLGLYERFEQVVCFVLTLVIAGVVLAALAVLLIRVAALLLLGIVDPAEPAVFQAIFGMILTVLIALEFNHTLLGVLERRHSIVQVRTVVLIALLAIARKFVILDLGETEAVKLLGLAAASLALGSVYWLVREQDRRDEAAGSGGPG